MHKFAIAVHGGAGSLSPSMAQYQQERHAGIEKALKKAYQVLKRGGTAVAAVKAAVMVLEDVALFNAGRGSTLNSQGKVEMDAAIMDGKSLQAGAVAIVQRVKNPVHLAYAVMKKSRHVLLAADGALQFAKQHKLILKPASYFITPYQQQKFQKTKYGTVGAVAIDSQGNLAAATSTGGTHYSLPGRVGDSCVIGAGCYANNRSCAVSGTGEGEYIITGVVAHRIALLMELKGYSLQKACDTVIHDKLRSNKGKAGVIAMNRQGQISSAFNTKMMQWGFIDRKGQLTIHL